MPKYVEWECVDCELRYNAPPDSGHELSHDEGVYAGLGVGGLPQFCPECGDHGGWQKVDD